MVDVSGTAVTRQFSLRDIARWMLCALLAGYLIFNKPFAQIGFPPLYIGEIVVAFCLAATLNRLNSVYLNPLQRSWTFRLFALFFAYGLVRACTGYFTYGFLALRDSATACYALLAFVAIAVLATATPANENNETADSSLMLAQILLPAGLTAGLWAACIQFNWFHLAGTQTKVDYLTMATAIGAWTCAISALKYRNESVVGSLTLAVLTMLLAWLVCALPTRTVWLSILPLAFVFGAAWMHTPARRRIFFSLSGVIAVALIAFVIWRIGPAFALWNSEYALGKIGTIDQAAQINLDLNPEKHEKPVPVAPATVEKNAADERIKSLLVPDESQFNTQAGRLGAHAVKWRAIFWMRCWNYTLAQAPLFGLGFGPNLTNLLRETPAWPTYIDSMRMDPPNRSPHCAHITVFARLGFAGLALWLAILGLVFWSGLSACWRQRNLVLETGSAVHQRRFWDTLTLLGAWTLIAWTMSFGVILEGPFGGMWFWTLSGVLAWSSMNTASAPVARSARMDVSEKINQPAN